MNYNVLVFAPDSKRPEAVLVEAETPRHALRRAVDARPDICLLVCLWRWQFRRLKRGFRVAVRPVPQAKPDPMIAQYQDYLRFMKEMGWSDRCTTFESFCEWYPASISKAVVIKRRE